MRKRKWIFVAAPLGIIIFIVIGGEIVMQLWNWLAPSLFGWRQVTFWQALGLLVLCRILFGGSGMIRSTGRRTRRRISERMGERWAERWEQMTPEEREKFRQGFQGRCGPFEPPDIRPTT